MNAERTDALASTIVTIVNTHTAKKKKGGGRRRGGGVARGDWGVERSEKGEAEGRGDERGAEGGRGRWGGGERKRD